MKKLNVVCFLLALVSLLAGGFAIFRSLNREQIVTIVSVPDPAPQVTLTVEHLYEIIMPCEKLVSASEQYGNSSEIADCRKWFGHKVPLTTDEIQFSYTGTVLVGVDLSTINLDINEAGKKIYVTLQSPEVIAHSIDTSSFVFTTVHNSLITEIPPDKFVAKANQLKSEQEDWLRKNGTVFPQAKKNAESVITKLIQAAPEAREYDLRFFYE